jgi:hypothetical protein
LRIVGAIGIVMPLRQSLGCSGERTEHIRVGTRPVTLPLLFQSLPLVIPRTLRRQPAARAAAHSVREGNRYQLLSFRTGFSR